MTEDRARDEMLLIEFLLGRADAEQGREIARRLPTDAPLRRLKQDVANTLAAMKLLPPVEPPANLLARTMARIDSARQAAARAARREASRPWSNSTFSLRELAAVAASLLLIVTILVPSMRQARRRAMQGQCASHLGQIGAGLSAYASQNGESLPVAADHRFRWLPGGSGPVVSNSSALYKLVQAEMAPPQVFQCPAAGREPLVAQSGMTDFPGAKFVTYSYQHPLSPEGVLRRDRFSPVEQASFVAGADQTPLVVQGQAGPMRLNATTSENHNSTGQNVLYLTSSVKWVRDANVGVGGDNIWHVEGVVDYRGDEQPARRTDTFLPPAYSGKP